MADDRRRIVREIERAEQSVDLHIRFRDAAREAMAKAARDMNDIKRRIEYLESQLDHVSSRERRQLEDEINDLRRQYQEEEARHNLARTTLIGETERIRTNRELWGQWIRELHPNFNRHGHF